VTNACERHREQPIGGKQVSNPDRIGILSTLHACMCGQKFVTDFWTHENSDQIDNISNVVVEINILASNSIF
jgi:hypothetical protein